MKYNHASKNIIKLTNSLFAFYLMLGISYAAEGQMWLGDWLKINEPRVIKYLSSLKSSEVGKTLKGVELSNGDFELSGLKFLGKVNNIGNGIHLYLFSDATRKYAYIWIDKNGDPLPLPDCGESLPGQYVLSGDIYTWKAVQPGHHIVILYCPKNEWLQMVK